ncbi:filamentous hemagglutinin N-terminal domain-containing protein, partial [Vibrio neptunius]
MDKRLTFSQVTLTYTLCCLMTLQPAMANVVIDTSVVNTSKVAAGNGVEVVNIATPDSNGLSHNQYQQFNVDSKGLILNNSTAQLAQSQLGGLLQNNPNLNGKSASVILNEVTGANRSKLEGYTEVFGQSANVILANPYGITCDGCGFINTPRVTFSTGTPEFEKGALSGFNVAEGSVSIEGLGLDASNQTYFDIISRTAEINAAIHANDLSIITGSNQVEYLTNKTIKQANSSSNKPQLAIDSSSIGGMYAGRIALIATEDGVGVNVGELSTTQGNITISANGEVRLGRMESAKSLEISSQDNVVIEGEQRIKTELSIEGAEVAIQDAKVAAGQNVNLDADGLTLLGSQIDTIDLAAKVSRSQLDASSSLNTQSAQWSNVSSLENQGSISVAETLDVSGKTLSVTGSGTIQTKQMSVSADALTFGSTARTQQAVLRANERLKSTEETDLSAVDNLTLSSPHIDTSGSIKSGSSLLLSGEKVVHRGQAQGKTVVVDAAASSIKGVLESVGDLTVQGEHLDITGTVQSTGEVVLAGGTQVSSGQDSQLLAGQRLRVTGPQVSLTGKTGTGAELVIEGNSVTLSGTVTSQDAVTVRGQSLSQSGVLASVGDMTLSQQDSVSLTGDVESGGALSVETGVLSSTQKLLSGKAMSLTANTTTLQGEVSSGEQLTLKSDSLTQSGQMVAKQALSLLSNKAQLNGRVQSDDTLSVTIQDDLNVGSQGQLVSQLPLTITSQTLVNQGQFSSGGDIDVSAEHLTHEGTILSAGKVSLNGRTLVQNGDIKANQGIQLITESDLVSDGDVISGGEILVTARSLDNRGEFSTSDALVVRVTEDVVNRGSGVLAGEQLTLSSRGITNAGTLQALDTLNLTAESLLNTGRVIALGQALINANQSINNSGVVSVDHTHALSSGTGAGSVLLRTASLTQSGTVVSSGDAQLLSDSQTLSGTTVIGGDLTVQGEHLDITGTVQSTGEVVLAGGTQVSSGQDSQLLAGQRLRVTGPQVSLTGKTGTGAKLVIEGDSVTLGGTVTSQDAVTVRGQSLSQSGVLASVGDMTLSQRDSVSLTGDVESGGALSVETGVLSSTQKLLSGKAMSIAADSIQLSGVVSSLSTLIAQAKTLTQTGRTLSLGDMTLKADQIVVSGEIQSGQSMLIAADNSLTTQSQSSLKAGVDLAANSEQFHHQGKWLSGSDSKVITKQLNNQGQLQSHQDFEVQAHQLAHQGTLASNRDLDITVNGEYNNQHALIAGRNLHLKAVRLENSSEISSRNLTQVELDEGLTNQSGGLISGDTTEIQAGDVANSGTLQAITALGLTSDSLHNSGALVSLSDLTLQSGGTLTNHGLLYAGGNANLFSENLNNYSDVLSGQGMVIARNATNERNTSVTNSSGTIESSGGDVAIYTGNLTNKRTTLEVQTVASQDKRAQYPALYNSRGTQHEPTTEYYKTDNCTDKERGSQCSWAYRILSGDEFTVLAYKEAVRLKNASSVSKILAKEDLVIGAGTVLNNSSQIAGKNVSISASSLTNKGYQFSEHTTYYDYKLIDGWSIRTLQFNRVNTRRVNHGGSQLNSSITAANRLNLNVSNTVNNSTIRANSAASGSTAQSRQWQATQSAVVSGPENLSLEHLADVDTIQSAHLETQTISNPTKDRVSEVSAPPAVHASVINKHPRPDIRLISSGPVPFPEFRLPTQPNGLFVFSPKPEGRYVIETNPLLTNLDQFLGSDYFQNQVDYYPEEDVTFLGDAFYDTRVITQAIFEQTGQRYLAKNVGSDLAQMQQLMDSAAAEKQALDLQVGIALSAQQVASLRQDIVWYETIEVNGKSVLAPKLYLAEVTKKHIVSGAQIAATHTDIQSGDLDNSGEIVGSGSLKVVSQDGISNKRGTIRGGSVSLTAENDILNLSGDILGENLALTSSSGSVINETLVKELRAMHGGGESVFTDIGRTANIGSGHSLSINAGENIENIAASISAGGDVSLAAVQDIVLDTKANTQAFDVDLGRKRVGEKT